MSDLIPSRPRTPDQERALREVSRVSDAVVSGLLKGLLEMQADLLRRLDEVESRVVLLEARTSKKPRTPSPR